ncbi:MAG: signal recognition particle-docking protein FtsY [Pseudomonadota bacterium]
MNHYYYVAAALFVIILITVIVFLKRKKTNGAVLSVGAKPAKGVRQAFANFLGASQLDESAFCHLEEALITADVGVATSTRFLESLKNTNDADEARRILKHEMTSLLDLASQVKHVEPQVIIVVGVNGCGKTTTIAKMARKLTEEGKRVFLIAADTFRAAAVDQLKIWGERLNVPVFANPNNSDAASIVFDGIKKGTSSGHDVIIVDTAGRLHTKTNLMDELKKISKVAGKAYEGAPHEKILVLDATVGQNGLVQAREFNEALGLTSVVVTKLDGTAKGGILFSVAGELNLPISYIGVGEGMEDLKPFDASEFVDSILKGN